MIRSFKAEVHSKEFLSDRHFILRLVPHSETLRPQPGQFYLLRTGPGYDPFLRRPFSVFNWSKDSIEFFIQKKGRGTEQLMRTSTGAVLEIIGPMGRGFPVEPGAGTPVLVGGGIGIAPLFYLAAQINGPKIVLYGGRSSEDLVLKRYLKEIDQLDIRLVTEDGSEGQKGTVVDALRQTVKGTTPGMVYICGPGPMIDAIRTEQMFRSLNIYVSVEERMACGVGVCLGCGYQTKEGMKRVCVEGPVFSLDEI